jgi:hypothetical protein
MNIEESPPSLEEMIEENARLYAALDQISSLIGYCAMLELSSIYTQGMRDVITAARIAVEAAP